MIKIQLNIGSLAIYRRSFRKPRRLFKSRIRLCVLIAANIMQNLIFSEKLLFLLILQLVKMIWLLKELIT